MREAGRVRNPSPTTFIFKVTWDKIWSNYFRMLLNPPSCSKLVITLLEQTLHWEKEVFLHERDLCLTSFSIIFTFFYGGIFQSMRNGKLPSSLCLPAWSPISVYSSPEPLLPARFPPRQHPTVNSVLRSESLTMTMCPVPSIPVLSPEFITVALHKTSLGFLLSSFHRLPFNLPSCSPWLIAYNKPQSGNVNGNSQKIQITQMLTIHHRKIGSPLKNLSKFWEAIHFWNSREQVRQTNTGDKNMSDPERLKDFLVISCM